MKNIKILLKKPKDNESLLLMIYRYSGKKFVLGLNERVLTKHWNYEKMRVRENSNYPEHVRLNYVIENWIKALTDTITYFEKENKNPSNLELKELTKQYKNPIQSVSNGLSNKVLNELVNFIKRIKESGKLAIGTIQSFDQLYNNLKSFKDGSSLEFIDLDLLRLKAFTKHLNRDQLKSNKNTFNYSQGQVNKLQRRLTQFLKECKELGININPAYESNKWKLKQPSIAGNNLYLSKSQIKIIEKIELEDELSKIRDRFLIGIYSGQRYSDFKHIGKKDIIEKNGISVLRIRQQKTMKGVDIPFHSKLEAIFKKYDTEPIIVNEQKFNVSIKRILKLAGINDLIKLERMENNKVISSNVRKSDLVSSHTCRRTFVTLAVRSGMPLDEVMKVSGHSSLATLSKYLKGSLEVDIETEKMYERVF